jgi:hypothetical protein
MPGLETTAVTVPKAAAKTLPNGLARFLLPHDRAIPANVGTGVNGEDGKELRMDVLIRDPGDPAILAVYLRISEDPTKTAEAKLEAMRELWRVCLIDPRPDDILADGVWDRTSTRLRTSLTNAISKVLGYDSFFEQMFGTMSPEAISVVMKSLTQSPEPTESTPPKSEKGSTSQDS